MSILNTSVVIVIFLCGAIAIVNPASAAEKKPLSPQFKSTLSVQTAFEDNRDLGTGTKDPAYSFAQQILSSAKIPLSRGSLIYIKGRAFRQSGDTLNATNDDAADVANIAPSSRRYLELRELYARQKYDDIAITLGRQRLRETQSLWWNSDNDLLRADFKTPQGRGFIAAGQDLFAYTTDKQVPRVDKNRFRLLGEFNHEFAPEQFIEPRFIAEYDHSGQRDIGERIQAHEVDDTDFKGVYLGARALGNFTPTISYRADVITMLGHEDIQSTSAVAGSDDYTVTALEDKSIRAWALDTGVTFDAGDNTKFTASFALAPKDFHQSGLHGSYARDARFGEVAARPYGEVFRPELSNMAIARLGVGQKIARDVQVDADYFYFHQLDAQDTVRKAAISAQPNGDKAGLGHEIDVNAHYDAARLVGHDVKLRGAAGVFMPAGAFDESNEEPSYRIMSEIRVGF